MSSFKSPSLEIISDRSGESDTRERRRRPRLSLTSEQFRLTQIAKIFSVADLSLEGMALRILDRNDLLVMPVAAEIVGVLNLRGHRLPVRAQVRHLGAQVVGCQFVELSPEVRKVLSVFLDPEAMGRELRPIPASDTGSVWYHGPSGTDVLLSRGSDGQYRRLTLYVLGSFVQWDVDAGLSTGTARSTDERSSARVESWGVVQFETMLMDADPRPDADKLSIAKALLMSSNFPQDLKKWCIRQLTVQ
jgi:hypothetical protein